jgi:formate hydrogenlyase subunit 6/NADH:ubiquinone oxidoreductase subunit I
MPATLRLVAMALGRDLATVAWPEERLVREGPARGVPVIDRATCTACGDCVDACPSGCLSLVEGMEVPLVDAGACVRCGRCVIACGEEAVSLAGPDDLASYSRSDLVLDGSAPREVEMGPAPSRLYRTSVGQGSGRRVGPGQLLERRSRELGPSTDKGSGK